MNCCRIDGWRPVDRMPHRIPPRKMAPVDGYAAGFYDGSYFVAKDGHLVNKGLDGEYHRADLVTTLLYDSLQAGYKLYQAANSLSEEKKADGLRESARETQESIRKNIWVVDESSMVGARFMKELLAAAEKYKARVVLVGDRQQLGSVEAGRAFALMQDNGMRTFKLEEIVRQKDADLKSAVENAYRGRADEALRQIDKRGGIVEIRDPKRQDDNGKTFYDKNAGRYLRAEAIKNDFLAQSKQDREKSIVVAPGKEDRKIINEVIREGLKEEGTVNGKEVTAETYQNKNLTKAEAKEAMEYEKDDVIRFGRDYSKHGISKGEYWRVKSIDKEANIVKIENNGKIVDWNPAKWGKRTEAYSSEKRKISVGDKIVWSRNDKTQGIYNSEDAKIVSLNGNKADVQLKNGNILRIDLDAVKHWDHGYARTTFSSQGQTAKRAFVHAEGWRLNLQNQRNMYVGISRPELEVKIYANDKAGVIDAMRLRTGEKASAISGSMPDKIMEGHQSPDRENGRPVERDPDPPSVSGNKSLAKDSGRQSSKPEQRSPIIEKKPLVQVGDSDSRLSAVESPFAESNKAEAELILPKGFYKDMPRKNESQGQQVGSHSQAASAGDFVRPWHKDEDQLKPYGRSTTYREKEIRKTDSTQRPTEHTKKGKDFEMER